MSIQDVRKEGEKPVVPTPPKPTISDDYEIPEVNIEGLFVEPEISGLLSKILPYINIGVLAVLTIKLIFFK